MLEFDYPNEANRSTNRTWIGGLGIILAASGLTIIGHGAGALAGVAIVACWYTVPVIYTVGVGFLLLTVVAPGTTFSAWGVGIALGLGLVLVEPAVGHHDFRRVVVATVVAIAFLGGSGWAVARASDDIWPVAAVVVALSGGSLYALHRYERARIHQAGVASNGD